MCHLKAEKNILNHSECLLSQILFHCFVCMCICFFLFYYPYYVCYNPIMKNLSVDGHHLVFFYMTEHNYSVFCNQKQGSTKNVNANLSGNLYGATYFFPRSLGTYDINKMYCTIRQKHKSIYHIVLMLTSLLNKNNIILLLYM